MISMDSPASSLRTRLESLLMELRTVIVENGHLGAAALAVLDACRLDLEQLLIDEQRPGGSAAVACGRAETALGLVRGIGKVRAP
jgi:hypothetical protein